MNDLLKLIRGLAWLSVAGAVYQELRKPPDERTWHGRVMGVVPYDFRMPTLDRAKRAYWDPSSDRMFGDPVFGVGWAVNIPVAARRIRSSIDQYVAASRRRGSSEPAALPRSGSVPEEASREAARH